MCVHVCEYVHVCVCGMCMCVYACVCVCVCERERERERETPLKLVDPFLYLGSNISSTESDVHIRTEKTWTAIDRLSIIWESDFSDKIKWDFFQTMPESVLLYGCSNWNPTKTIKKKLDDN